MLGWSQPSNQGSWTHSTRWWLNMETFFSPWFLHLSQWNTARLPPAPTLLIPSWTTKFSQSCVASFALPFFFFSFLAQLFQKHLSPCCFPLPFHLRILKLLWFWLLRLPIKKKNPPTFRSKIRHSVQPVAWISKALWDTQMSSSKPAYLPPFFLQVTLIFPQHYFPIYLIAKTVLVCSLLFRCKYNSATIRVKYIPVGYFGNQSTIFQH